MVCCIDNVAVEVEILVVESDVMISWLFVAGSDDEEEPNNEKKEALECRRCVGISK